MKGALARFAADGTYDYLVADLPDIVPLLLEVFMWVGFGVGGFLFLIGLIPLALSSRWVKTEGVVIAGPSSAETYRWIDREGEVQEATGEATLVREPGDEITVWFDSWRPSKGRTEVPENGKA